MRRAFKKGSCVYLNNRQRTLSKVHNAIPLFVHVATISPCQRIRIRRPHAFWRELLVVDLDEGLGLVLRLGLGLGKVVPCRIRAPRLAV
jgi:hypothetical protein